MMVSGKSLLLLARTSEDQNDRYVQIIHCVFTVNCRKHLIECTTYFSVILPVFVDICSPDVGEHTAAGAKKKTDRYMLPSQHIQVKTN